MVLFRKVLFRWSCSERSCVEGPVQRGPVQRCPLEGVLFRGGPVQRGRVQRGPFQRGRDKSQHYTISYSSIVLLSYPCIVLLSYSSYDDNYASAHNNMATLLSDDTEKEWHLRQALKIQSNHHGAHINLGTLLL